LNQFGAGGEDRGNGLKSGGLDEIVEKSEKTREIEGEIKQELPEKPRTWLAKELQFSVAAPGCEMDDLIKDFLQESRENLDHLDQDFVKLETDPNNSELLKSIFRTIHTIKGTCGFVGLTKLEALTHAGESLLSLLRDGEIELNEECADVLLEMVDAVRGYLEQIESTEAEGAADPTELIARLKRLQEEAGNARNSKSPCKEEKPAGVETGSTEAPTKAEKSQAEPKDATIRVDVNLLEKQMNLVSELVLLRNRLLQLAIESNERNLNATVHGLNYVTSELRKNVMKTRMQQVSQLLDLSSSVSPPCVSSRTFFPMWCGSTRSTRAGISSC